MGGDPKCVAEEQRCVLVVYMGTLPRAPFKGGLAVQLLGSGPPAVSCFRVCLSCPRSHSPQGSPQPGTEWGRGIENQPFGCSMGHSAGHHSLWGPLQIGWGFIGPSSRSVSPSARSCFLPPSFCRCWFLISTLCPKFWFSISFWRRWPETIIKIVTAVGNHPELNRTWKLQETVQSTCLRAVLPEEWGSAGIYLPTPLRYGWGLLLGAVKSKPSGPPQVAAARESPQVMMWGDGHREPGLWAGRWRAWRGCRRLRHWQACYIHTQEY